MKRSILIVDGEKVHLGTVLGLIIESKIPETKIKKVSYDEALEAFIFGNFSRVLVCEGYEERNGMAVEMSVEVASDIRNSADSDVKILRLGFGDEFDITLIASIDEIIEALEIE